METALVALHLPAFHQMSCQKSFVLLVQAMLRLESTEPATNCQPFKIDCWPPCVCVCVYVHCVPLDYSCQPVATRDRDQKDCKQLPWLLERLRKRILSLDSHSTQGQPDKGFRQSSQKRLNGLVSDCGMFMNGFSCFVQHENDLNRFCVFFMRVAYRLQCRILLQVSPRGLP